MMAASPMTARIIRRRKVFPRRLASVMPRADALPARGVRAAARLRRIGRHHHHAAVPHAALGDHVLRKMLDRAGLALEHGHFHATVVVEMDVQGGQRQFVVIVEGLGEALRQLAGSVIVNIHQGGDAIALGVQSFGRLADTGAGQVADGFGAVLIAAAGNDAVELDHELIVDRNGHALHEGRR